MPLKPFNLRELVFGWPCSLRYVNRYSTSRCIRPENVAEHTAFVVLYALLIARWVIAMRRYDYQRLAPESFIGDVLERASLHDLEECRTGDIHRPFKYSNPELRRNLNKAAQLAMRQISQRIFPEDEGSPQLSEQMFDRWDSAKDRTPAGCIVRFADYLSVVSFVSQEGKDAPERLCLDTMKEHFESFQTDEDFNFIRELVDEASILTKEVLGE